MAGVSGPELDEQVELLREWFASSVEWMVEQLSQGYPFGSTPLSEMEQLTKYLAMQPEDWQAMIGQLESLHMGKPNMRKLVQTDLEKYARHMEALKRKYQPGGA